MELTANYTSSTFSPLPSNIGAHKDDLVAIFFCLSILSIFFFIMLFATCIRFVKPEWLEMQVPPDRKFRLADCAFLNVLAPCTSCNFRSCLNGCCPRMNLKQRLNCFTDCENRQERLNLVCCSV